MLHCRLKDMALQLPNILQALICAGLAMHEPVASALEAAACTKIHNTCASHRSYSEALMFTLPAMLLTVCSYIFPCYNMVSTAIWTVERCYQAVMTHHCRAT